MSHLVREGYGGLCGRDHKAGLVVRRPDALAPAAFSAWIRKVQVDLDGHVLVGLGRRVVRICGGRQDGLDEGHGGLCRIRSCVNACIIMK